MHDSNNSTDNPGDKRFFGGNPIRPPYLTECERLRFIRAAYQLWSLNLLDSKSRQLKIRTLKYKDLYTLMDLGRFQFWADGVLILDKECIQIEKADPGRFEHISLFDISEADTRILAEFYHEGRTRVF